MQIECRNKHVGEYREYFLSVSFSVSANSIPMVEFAMQASGVRGEKILEVKHGDRISFPEIVKFLVDSLSINITMLDQHTIAAKYNDMYYKIFGTELLLSLDDGK